MKKGLTIAVATCLAACTWYSLPKSSLQKNKENLPAECVYIGSPVFSIDVKGAAALPSEDEKPAVQPETNVIAESIEMEIAEFTETEIPAGIETYSSSNGLLGEIARADVKISVSEYRYETADHLIEPEEVASKPTILAMAAAPPVELPLLADEVPEIIESGDPVSSGIIADSETIPSDTETLTISESDVSHEATDTVPKPDFIDNTEKSITQVTDTTDVHDQITFDAAPYMKTIAKTWRKAPRKCIEAAKRVIENADSVSTKDLAEAWYRKGRAHRLVNEPLSAIKAHQMAAATAPDSASYLNGYAWILSTVKPYKYRDHEKALATAQKAVELSERTSANYLDTLGRTFSMLGHHEEAFLAQKEAVSLSPGKKSFRKRLKKYEAKLLVAD